MSFDWVKFKNIKVHLFDRFSVFLSLSFSPCAHIPTSSSKMLKFIFWPFNHLSVFVSLSLSISLCADIPTFTRHPLVELVGPVLKRVDRDDDQDLLSFGVPQEAIHEGDHLKRLPESHTMRQNAAKSLTLLKLKERKSIHTSGCNRRQNLISQNIFLAIL